MDRYLSRLQREIDSAIAGLSTGQMAWHPEGKWCTADILEHLCLTYTGTTKGFNRMMEAGKPLARAATLQDHLRLLVVLGFGHLPDGRQAPPFTRPRGLPVEGILTGIVSRLAEMDHGMNDCAEKFGPRRKVLDHPFLGPMSVEQWRKFHLVHGMHHVKQIRRLRENMP
ncbi:MAG TPA: DUF1569 domain-containing protein [Candidatus Sulfotelmatobacter sp.]|jgi:hypothetical protein